MISSLNSLIVSRRSVALVTLVALLMWAMGVPTWINFAQAASLESVSDTITDSDVNAAATHTVQFDTPTGIAAGEQVRITFDPTAQNFDLSALTNGDVASSTTHTVHTGAGGCGAGNDFFVNNIDTSSDFVEYELCAGDTIAADTTVSFIVGSSTSNQVTNPATAQSYVIQIDGGASSWADSADTRVAIIDDVLVTAEVQTTLQFVISGVADGNDVNGENAASGLLTATSTTATTVPFEVISPGSGNAKVLAQDLAVTTNALNGFTVTVEADQTLTSGNGADIDTFVDGDGTTTPISWQSPAGTFGSENTYGHWGLTTEDSTLAGGDDFGSALYAGNFVNNAREVFFHNGPADGSTADQGSTRVGYKVEIDALQEAADDYTATLTYVATPIF